MIPNSSAKASNNQTLGDEIRDMISKLTHHVTNLNEPSSSSASKSLDERRQNNGVITLAGGNKGATLKADSDEIMDPHGFVCGDDDGFGACTNNNYQSINNSIVFGGSCEVENPGIHLVIAERMEVYADEHGRKESEMNEDGDGAV